VPGRFGMIVGSKFEDNDFTGFEYQPTFRLRWTPGDKQMVWGGISRAVRMPTRIDSDLRFTAGTPIVVVRGNPDFQSEVVIAREIGYRLRTIPRVALGVTAFLNSYDKLRSQEPTPPTGFPIVVGNKHNGRIAGLEIGAQYDPSSRWQIQGSYSGLRETFSFDADSLDPTGGRLEHNDPPHQARLRSFSDLPGRFAFDATLRWVAALPAPVVPAYTELTLRVAHPLGQHLELEVVGDNLLHDRHLEFVQLGPPHAVPRSVFARLTWRQR
jgi:iron complex outermembrane recepter protein